MPDIDNLSGAELDELMATRVMGWTREGDVYIDRPPSCPDIEGRISVSAFRPAEDELQMLRVLDKALKDKEDSGDWGWDVTCRYHKVEYHIAASKGLLVSFAHAPTLALAVCRALANGRIRDAQVQANDAIQCLIRCDDYLAPLATIVGSSVDYAASRSQEIQSYLMRLDAALADWHLQGDPRLILEGENDGKD